MATNVTVKEPEVAHEQISQQDHPADHGKPPLKTSPDRRHTVLLSVALMAFVAFVVIFFIAKSRQRANAEAPATTEAAQTAPNPNVVTIDPGQNRDIKFEAAEARPFTAEKNATGKIAFDEDLVTPVFTIYTGRIVRLMAKPGDFVKTGDPLFEIDTPDVVQAEQDLITATTSTAKAKTALELARRTEDRQHRLYVAKAAALKDWEQAQSDLQSAENDLRAAQAAESGGHHRLTIFGKTPAEISAIETTRTIDRLTKVVSPISGTVTARKVGTGQYVKPDNPDPLFTISNLSSMWMLADIYESDVPLIKVGQPAEVKVLAYPNEVFKARISYINASVDPTTHRVGVRCEVENHGGKLKPEMFASFKIITNAVVQSLAVRQDAIVRDGDKASVWVAEDGNKFERKQVTTGIQDKGYVQILSGLNPGDKVVYDGSLFLSNVGQS
jgi:cobalt-zinc-cadmium efflux system membrane fusion protein